MTSTAFYRIALWRSLLVVFFATALHFAPAQLSPLGVVDPSTAGLALDISADNIEYLADNKTVVLTGNVRLIRGREQLTARRVTYRSDTREATAEGNVVFQNGTETWSGEKLFYNFALQMGDFGFVTLTQEPFTVHSVTSEQLNAGHFRLDDVTVTTCDPDNVEFWIRATSADVFDRKIVRARNAVFYIEGVPVLYLPTFTLDFEREPTHFDFLPGYSSRHGAYALSAFSIPWTDSLTSTSRLDYRSERGLALGQDFKWRDRENQDWRGLFQSYYAMDDKPYRNAEQEERKRAEGIDIPEDRYRVRLSHTASLSDRDMLFVEAGAVSDAEINLDFFRDEYLIRPEQENRVSLVHVDDFFTAGIELNYQVNSDLFTNVNRTPEATLNVNRTPIMDSGLYYQGANSASILEKTHSDRDLARGREDYDTQRIHTSHQIFYPTRHLGFLNIIPRVGYTGTFYGDTFETVDVNRLVRSVSTNGVETVTTNSVQEVRSLGADMRHLPELGFETSFKAFGVLHEEPTAMGVGLRHVVEPFSNYTFIPEPDLRPTNIFQFDSIDRLDRRNDVRFGVRNKFQTKVDADGQSRVLDMLDAVVFTTYRLDPENEEPNLGLLEFDIEARPVEWVSFDFDGGYDTDESEVAIFNSRIRLISEEKSSLALEYRYRVDTRSLVQASYRLFPSAPWSLEGYSRHNIEDGEFEEQNILISKKNKCVGYGVGVRWIAGDYVASQDRSEEDDWQVYAQLWLLAFPKSIVQLGR